MAKGAIAKDNLIKRFITALGDDYVGVDETGKKFYFWSTENGERLQVAITMTYAKNPIAGNQSGGDLNFEDAPVAGGVAAPTKVKPMEKEEADILARLKEELGL